MGIKITALASNTESITGMWHEYIPGFKVCIAKWGNPRHRAAIERNMISRIEGGEVIRTDFDYERIAAAEGLVTGIEGLENEDGTPFVFNVENVTKLLTNDSYWEFYAFIKAKALAMDSRKAVSHLTGN